MNQEKIEMIEKISYQIIDEAIKDLLINFKFLDLALSTINFSTIDSELISQIGTDGKTIYFNANYLIEKFKKQKDDNIINNARMIMHSLIHCLFYHIGTSYMKDCLNNFQLQLYSLNSNQQ